MLTRLKHAVRDQPLLRAGALRAGSLLTSMAAAPPGLYTLCYHHVAAKSGASFATQIAFLKQFGSFLSMDAAIERLLAGEAATERAFVLTFDDGYRDNLEVAMPVLQQAGVPAMLFLVSDWIDRPPMDGQAYLDRAGARAWLKAGFDIGSHSASHRRFSTLDAASAAEEMTRSAGALADLAGRPVRHFACPWGVSDADYDPARDPALAQAAGFSTFFTTRRGHATAKTDMLSMPRHVLEPEWPVYQLQTLMGGRKRVGG